MSLIADPAVLAEREITTRIVRKAPDDDLADTLRHLHEARSSQPSYNNYCKVALEIRRRQCARAKGYAVNIDGA